MPATTLPHLAYSSLAVLAKCTAADRIRAGDLTAQLLKHAIRDTSAAAISVVITDVNKASGSKTAFSELKLNAKTNQSSKVF